jgi:hypothetical protein
MRKILEWLGVLGIILVVGVAGYGLFRMLYWDPRHRPVVVIGSETRSPWQIESDGRAQCNSLAPAHDEAGLRQCRFVLEPGDHVLLAKGADGTEIRRANVHVTLGDQDYLWLPDLPQDRCVFKQIVKYSREPALPGFGAPKHPQLAPGFHELSAVSYWFEGPPSRISTKERDPERLAIRLKPCDWTE